MGAKREKGSLEVQYDRNGNLDVDERIVGSSSVASQCILGNQLSCSA